MSESAFEVQVRLALHEAYYPYGGFWNNKTGWSSEGLTRNHDPFGGRGAGDLIGCVLGLWIEVENKARAGKLRELQTTRRDLVTKFGGLYVVCKEVGLTSAIDFDDGFRQVRLTIDGYIMLKVGGEALNELWTMRAAKVAKVAKVAK